ncbi:3-hydroxyacyl-CoA dehydrogenase [Filomicrobium insigne]|uniref:3-hydroxyacyl-CoA dehydrogenase n=1 Tax=Filomicrobium insigne TaxID=418854 RepID=A0A1H0TRM0_9HYPH|nr:3-hydroxyacyl-CoA dehydrogenase [Filomicrobium insigne]SDP56278.1 3-hydroxyacyl-CoA dehydrogenase [Filomicrobium insigne]
MAEAISAVGVVGAGAMGRGIAQVAAVGGYEVILIDSKPGVAEDAKGFIAKLLARSVEKGRMEQKDAEIVVGRITTAESLSQLNGCDLVVEAVIEDLDVKQALLAELEGIVRSDCILASNTSSLSIAAIAAKAKAPERIAGFHFFNPVPLMRLVEVIDGIRTAPWVCEALMEVGRRMGREPVRVKDAPGFLVNQIGRGYTIEAAHVVDESIATTEDVDRVMRDLVGFRMGPFELMDLTGLDVTHPATELIHQQFFFEPRYRPSLLMAQRTAAGILGRKSNGGFYLYKDGQPIGQDEPAAPSTLPSSVWISQANPDGARAILGALEASGVKVEAGERPSDSALCLVAPLGDDATTTALKENLDPARTVAVETLFAMGRRRVIMPTPATTAEMLEAAQAVLAAGGISVTVLRDSPGFVAQRIVAMIINICCAIAQSGGASPEDVDKAPTLALNYPAGPLSLGDRIGPQKVHQILSALFATYGDPRYRPSPWLTRRARLGLSLKAPERMPV